VELELLQPHKFACWAMSVLSAVGSSKDEGKMKNGTVFNWLRTRFSGRLCGHFDDV
jgi:hypothetical protein